MCIRYLLSHLQATCTVVAVLLHLFFTAAFTWMLCEGIMLYIKLVKIIYSGIFTKWWLYMVIGWGKSVFNVLHIMAK